MYSYKLVNNDDFKVAYKKNLRKNLLKGSLIIISIATLILFILLSLFLVVMYKFKIVIIICIASLILILESLIFYKSYKKESEKMLNNTTNSELNIYFDEKEYHFTMIIYQDILTGRQ